MTVIEISSGAPKPFVRESKKSPNESVSKREMISFAISGVIGAIIAILGSLNIFGPIGSAGFIASEAVGGLLIGIAIGGIIWMICKCRGNSSLEDQALVVVNTDPSANITTKETFDPSTGERYGEIREEKRTVDDEGRHVLLVREHRAIKRPGMSGFSVREEYEGEIDGIPASQWLREHGVNF